MNPSEKSISSPFIFIDIPNKDLDNPGWYSREGELQKVDKSKVTRDYFLKYYDRLKERQIEYANKLGVDYVLHEYDNNYKNEYIP